MPYSRLLATVAGCDALLAAKIKNDRLDKERQPLFVLVPSWLSPVGGEANRGHRIAVRLRSDSVWFAIEK